MSDQNVIEQSQGVAGGSSSATGSTCPLCGSQLKWKLSGTGKHFGGHCQEHGFMAIIRHPLFQTVPRRRGVIERIGDYMMGR